MEIVWDDQFEDIDTESIGSQCSTPMSLYEDVEDSALFQADADTTELCWDKENLMHSRMQYLTASSGQDMDAMSYCWIFPSPCRSNPPSPYDLNDHDAPSRATTPISPQLQNLEAATYQFDNEKNQFLLNKPQFQFYQTREVLPWNTQNSPQASPQTDYFRSISPFQQNISRTQNPTQSKQFIDLNALKVDCNTQAINSQPPTQAPSPLRPKPYRSPPHDPSESHQDNTISDLSQLLDCTFSGDTEVDAFEEEMNRMLDGDDFDSTQQPKTDINELGQELDFSEEDSGEDCKKEEKKNINNSKRRRNRMYPNGKPRLYKFLLEMLETEQKSCIDWLDKGSGTFKIQSSTEIAHRWGLRKNKSAMKYENFARSLRTYIKKGILTKPKNKLVYGFADHIMREVR